MLDYEVSGLKYVPVKVKTSDYEDFKKAYTVVENDGTLVGGYGEVNLRSYNLTADVTANTNGLKTATKNEDGTFSFKVQKVEQRKYEVKNYFMPLPYAELEKNKNLMNNQGWE